MAKVLEEQDAKDITRLLVKSIENGKNPAKMEDFFGIPHGNEVRLVLAIGYAAGDIPGNKIRKPMSEVCSFNRWE